MTGLLIMLFCVTVLPALIVHLFFPQWIEEDIRMTQQLLMPREFNSIVTLEKEEWLNMLADLIEKYMREAGLRGNIMGGHVCPHYYVRFTVHWLRLTDEGCLKLEQLLKDNLHCARGGVDASKPSQLWLIAKEW